MGNFLSSITEKFKENWRIILVIAAGLLVIVLSLTPKEESNGAGELSLDEYGAILEERVAAACSSVEGVGKCKVLITFERGSQTTYKGSALLEVKPPKVLGVTVVCRGADSDTVRRELTLMLCALFDVGSNRVAILKLN